jgi:acyl-coenzyme A thioesterase PaaI-like protein
VFKAGQRASTAEQRAAKASAQAGQLLAEVNADAGRRRAATRREVDDLTLTGTEVQVQRAVNVWESEVTVLAPMVVVDELDRLFADGPGRARLRKGCQVARSG